MRGAGIALMLIPSVMLVLHYWAAVREAARCGLEGQRYDYLQGICFRNDEYLPYDTYSVTYGWAFWLVGFCVAVGLVLIVLSRRRHA